MVENLEIDQKGLLKHRGIRKLTYNGIRYVVGKIINRYFDIDVKGKENVPDTSCVIATHHTVSFDWMFMLNSLERTCHAWFDEDVMRRNGMIEGFFEQICVRTDKEATRAHLKRTMELSKFWLENDDGYVVSVTDGPSKYLLNEDGEGHLPLKDRPLYGGLADLAYKTDSIIIPYASKIPEEHSNALFASKGVRNDFRYMRQNKKIPYGGMFGKPLVPKEVGNKREFRNLVREAQLDMYNSLDI